MSNRYFPIIRTFLVFLFAAQAMAFAVTPTSGIPKHQNIAAYSTQKKLDQVLFLMQKRLAIMHEVARTKWNQNLQIEDLPREQQIIASLVKQGESYGMDDAWIRKFFQAQFDAAKLIQQNDFVSWSNQKHEKFESILDLKQDIRPYLDQLSLELMDALARIYSEAKEGKIAPFLLATCLSNRFSDFIEDQIWQVAISPLLN